MTRASVLVFAGCDPSGGAGIAADIEAVAAAGAHALPVVTVLTVQDNDRVHAIHPVAAALVRSQAQALVDKIEVAAVKIGIVGNRANAEAIAAVIGALRQRQPGLPVVLDTVLASGHGDALAVEDPAQAIAPLLPLATLATPNLPEAAALCGGERDGLAQAQSLLRRGARHVLIKGGHGQEQDSVINTWYRQEGEQLAVRRWTWPRLPGAFHGSGCTLASAIAARLALGRDMESAIEDGQAWCQQALARSYAIAAGQRIPGRIATLEGYRA